MSDAVREADATPEPELVRVPGLPETWRAPSPQALVLRMQATVGNRATARWLGTPVARRRVLARRSWAEEKAEGIRQGLKADKWDEEGGAFWFLNGLDPNGQKLALAQLTAEERRRLAERVDQSNLGRDRMKESLRELDWWGVKVAEVHAAIGRGDMFGYPTGAYWIINPLNTHDQVKLMTLLSTTDLDAIGDFDDQAVEKGVPNGPFIAAEAKKARAQRNEPPRDPTKVVVRGMYIDDFKEAHYDIDYRINEGGSPSEWLKVLYKDGTSIDLNYYDFDDVTLTADEVKAALLNQYVGIGGRVVPKREPKNKDRLGLTRQLCPRLWAVNKEAEEIGAESTIAFMMLSYTLTMFVLSIPAMPAGARPGIDGSSPKVTRRAVPRGSRTPTAPKTPAPNEAPPKPVDEAPPTPKLVSSKEVTVARVKPLTKGPAADYGKALGQKMVDNKTSGPKALRPVTEDLNANTTFTPAEKADAIKAAVDAQPNFGAGPVVDMEGNHVVTPQSLSGPTTDVIVVQPSGRVVRGYADIAYSPDKTMMTVKDLRIRQ
jgi:hypothetical protein